jgi:HEPN domain-containing protein
MKNPLAEARRWWDQAVDDLAFVRWIREEGRFFDKGCFVAQQAAEKALKACHYARGERFVPGHSTYELWEGLAASGMKLVDLADPCRRLDRVYIPTRYPSGLPGGVPASVFAASDLDQAMRDATTVAEAIGAWLRAQGGLKEK